MTVQRIQRLAKEGGWVLFGQALVITGSLVGVRVMTELLTPQAYGELALGMSGAMLINQFAFGPLGQGATRFFAPSKEAGESVQYFGSVLRFVVLVTGATSVLALVVVLGLAVMRRAEWIGIVIACLFFAILSGYGAILRGIENAARRRSIVALHEGAETWLRFFVAGSLVLFLGATSTMAMTGYVIAVGLVFASQYFFFRRAHTISFTRSHNSCSWFTRIFAYSWPFATWGIFFWAQRASERWALAGFVGAEEVGLYAVLFQLGYYPMSIATDMTMRIISPVVFQRAGDGRDATRIENTRFLCLRLAGIALVLGLVAFIITIRLHEELFAIFAGERFRSLSGLLPWMVLNGCLFATGQTISLILMSEMKTREMITVKITTAIVGVALNVVGASLYQTRGVVFAGVLASAIYLVWITTLSNSKKTGYPQI